MDSLAAVLIIWLSDGSAIGYEYADEWACGDAILRLAGPIREIDPGADLICDPGDDVPPARSPRPRPRP